MTPQEREELERELAAELAQLSELDEDDDEDEAQEVDDDGRNEYVRLDLAAVLRKTQEKAPLRGGTAGIASGGEDGVLSTWQSLQASVERCDTQVFQVFALEMDALRLELQGQDTRRSGFAAQEKSEDEHEGTVTRMCGGGSAAETAAVHEDRNTMARSLQDRDDRSVPQDAPELDAAAAQLTLDKRTERQELLPSSQVPAVQATTTYVVTTLLNGVEQSPQLDALKETEHILPPTKPPWKSPEPSLEPVEIVQPPAALATLPLALSLHAQRVSALVEAQRLANDQLETWMAHQQRQWEQDQEIQDLIRQEAKREMGECLAMQHEEDLAFLYVVQQRLARERTQMGEEDLRSSMLETWWMQETKRAKKEHEQMALEEMRVWRIENEKKKEQRVEEVSQRRRWYHRVMEELVQVWRAKAEAKRRAEEVERRRAARECSGMRIEEHWMRRVLIEEKAAKERERRHYERRRMEAEDVVANHLREEERARRRRRAEELECASMMLEEERSRVWETLGRLRIKSMTKCMVRRRGRDVRTRWLQWRAVVAERIRAECEQAERIRREHAAWRIQRCVQRYVDMRRRGEDMNQPEEDEEDPADEYSEEEHTEENTEEHTEEHTTAARLMQSAFRGFHVRRKFMNALELAKTMGGAHGEDGEEYGEVDLDDLIQSPPELDDDWEKPTIQKRLPVPVEHPEIQSDDDESDADGQDSYPDPYPNPDINPDPYPVQPVQLPSRETPSQKYTGANANTGTGGGTNLAAVLWNRMRKKGQKQQQQLEERQKQQDPAYRVKKLLQGKTKATAAAATTSSNNVNTASDMHHQAQASTVSWSMTTDKKKAPKVNVPSLVERLRKKTAAAR